MYRLFNDAPPISGGAKHNPRFTYENTVVQRNIDRLVEYRQANTGFVESDHLLVSLLRTLNVRYSGNDLIFYEQVKRRVFDVSTTFKITSFAHRGSLVSGVLFSNKSYEALVSVDEDMPNDMSSKWMEKEPIRVLSSPRSDLSIETLDGKGKEPEVGLAVVTINIPLLALQYEYWKRSTMSGATDQHRSAEHFLYQIPLTNAVRSHLDVALLNRMHRIAVGLVPSSYKFRNPFVLTNNDHAIDRVIGDVLEWLNGRDMSFEDMLRNIPAFNNETSLETVQVKKLPYTQQVIWALVAARINVVSMLLLLNAQTEGKKVVDDTTEIKRDLIRMESGKLLSNGLPSPVVKDIRDRIAGQIEPFL